MILPQICKFYTRFDHLTTIEPIYSFSDVLFGHKFALAIYEHNARQIVKKNNMKKVLILLSSILLPLSAPAQEAQTLTLEDCRQMAVSASRDLEQARIDVQMAGYDRKIALANYFPNVSATGAYLYNNRDIALVSDSQSELLRSAGTLMQNQLNASAANAIGQLSGQFSGAMTQLMTAIKTNPALAADSADKTTGPYLKPYEFSLSGRL